jgi:hypothetical protein
MTVSCQPLAPAALYAETYFCLWYSFLLEAKETPGPNAIGKIRQIENVHSPIESGNLDIPTCSVVRLPTTLPIWYNLETTSF